MLIKLVNALLAFTQDMGYGGIVLLMAVESSFLPMPSELVVPPAAYLAAQGKMNIWLVIAASVLGSIIGATFNYYLARFLGRPLIYKLANTRMARLMLIKPSAIQKSEDYFTKYDKSSTFIGRLVPVVRHLISIPAGFVKMPYGSFVLYTFLGSAIWSGILAALGYFFGANEALWHQYFAEISYGLILLAIVFIAWLVFKPKLKALRERV